MNWFKRIAQQDLPYTSIDVYGRRFETGVPVEFKYVRNNQKAPDFGSRYQQDIEPAGRYLIHNEDPGSEDYLRELERRGWEFGTHKFEHPLVMAFNSNNEAYYDENSWKAVLSRKFGGFKGEALARAIIGQGYDGVVTVRLNEKGEPLYVSEIVDLTGFLKQAQKLMPLPFEVSRREREHHMGYERIDNRMSQETSDQLQQDYPEMLGGDAGAIGVALRSAPGEMTKITHDWSEAKAATAVFENPVNWIARILEEPKMIQGNPPLWRIRMEKVQTLDDPMAIFATQFYYRDDANNYPDVEELPQMMRMGGMDMDRYDEVVKIHAHMKYIFDRNRQSFWITDIHGGNVGWGSDGNLKVFDLGPGNFIE